MYFGILVSHFYYILTLIFLILIGYFSFLSYLKSKQSIWTDQGLKIENFLISLLHNFSLISNPEKSRRQQGKLFAFYRGLTLILSCGDADVLRFILNKDFHIFTNRKKIESRNKIKKNFLFFLEDDVWRRVRSVISPTFTSSRLKKVKPLVDDCVNELIHNFDILLKNQRKTEINVYQAFEAYSMDVVVQMGYGTKVHSLIEETNNPLIQSAKTFFFNISKRFIWSFFISENILYALYNDDILTFFKNFALKITTARKIKYEKNQELKRNDFLQLIMDAWENNSSSESNNEHINFSVCKEKIISNEKIDKIISNEKIENIISNENIEKIIDETKDNQINNYYNYKTNKTLNTDEFVSQSVLFFLAGFDSIATLLSCSLYNLASHQDKQELLFDEVEKTIIETQGEIQFETVNSLKYLDAVICETLRLFPPFGFINRRTSQDYIIEKYNIKVPKGTTIHIPIYSIHHDPEYFTDPDQFKPERFFPENRNFHPYAFIPFGAGPRSCIGIRWALLKSKLALFHTIYNFRFSLIQQNSKFSFNGGTPILLPKVEWLNMEKRINL